MAKLQTVWIEDNAINDAKIKLTNNGYLKARNAANSADVNIIKVNASDAIEFASTPKVGANNVLTADLLGANSGIATLDGSGKIPSSQLTVAAMEYKGTYDASTDTPSLSNGTGSTGDVYAVSVAGTNDFGAGNITFAVGDWVIYNGSIYEKVTNSNSVTSVNGQTGVVSLDTDDIAEGTALYFTEARVLGTDLAGFSATNSAIVATDTVLQAFGKAQGQINNFVGADAEEMTITLGAGDITNQYVDLGFEAMVGSVMVAPKGGPKQTLTDDYTLSYTGGAGGVTRLTFAGDLASTLVAGHKLMVNYLKA